MGEQLVLYFDRNLEVLKSVLSCAEKAAKIRKTEERAKTNLLTKQKYSFDSNGSLQTVRKKTRLSVRFLLLREILRAVLRKQQETVIIRRSFRSEERS